MRISQEKMISDPHHHHHQLFKKYQHQQHNLHPHATHGKRENIYLRQEVSETPAGDKERSSRKVVQQQI